MAHFESLPPDEQQNALSLDREMCARSFSHWARNYAWIVNPHADKSFLREVPYHPWPKQLELVEWLDERVAAGEPAVINKGRCLGISWTCLLLCCHRWLFESLFGAKIGSRKEKLVDDGTLDSLFGKLRHTVSKQPRHLRPSFEGRVLKLQNLDNKSELVGEATNEGFARGARRTVAMIDEFAHIHPTMQARIWLAIETVAVSLWMPSTPNGKGNKFFDLYENLPSQCIFEMDWRADPTRPADWKEKQIRPIGRLTEAEFAQEHEGDFSAVLTGKIWQWDRELEYGESYWNAQGQGVNDPRRWMPHVGGWDFGSGTSLLVNLFGLIDIQNDLPHVYLDKELTWQQSDWNVAAADCVSWMRENYPHAQRLHFGDKAGQQRESNQRSWEQNLQGGGVPLVCLGSEYSTHEANEWMIKEVQQFIHEGRLHIHRRCTYILSCIDNWKRNAPDGVELDWISSTYIAPRKDVYSHGANALMYLIAGVVLTSKRLKQDVRIAELEETKSAEIRKALSIR